MNLSHIPTPINDQFTLFMNGADDSTHLVALDLLSRDLERRLTVARDALETVAQLPIARMYPDGPCLERSDMEEVRKALTLTAPKL